MMKCLSSFRSKTDSRSILSDPELSTSSAGRQRYLIARSRIIQKLLQICLVSPFPCGNLDVEHILANRSLQWRLFRSKHNFKSNWLFGLYLIVLSGFLKFN
jgi:hypothetical protein